MGTDPTPVIEIDLDLDPAGVAQNLSPLVSKLPARYFDQQRWYGNKGQGIFSLELRDAGVISGATGIFGLCLVDVKLEDGTEETYFVPLALTLENPGSTGAIPILRVVTGKSNVLVSEAFDSPEFRSDLMRHFVSAEPVQALKGVIEFGNTSLLRGSELGAPSGAVIPSRLSSAEQSNTSVIYGDSFILKGFRRLQNGPNPDLEIPLFITSRSGFQPVPGIGGFAEYVGNDGFRASVFALQSFVPNLGDGWRFTLNHLNSFLDHRSSLLSDRESQDAASVADAVRSFCSDYLGSARQLGEITADLHAALESGGDDPDFAPELITGGDARGWAAAMEEFALNAFDEVAKAAVEYPEEVRAQIADVIDRKAVLLRSFEKLSALATRGTVKTRHHGDYHLGQVLKTANGFVIIDFEGEPARPLAERREKQSPLRDVGGMLRSFNYAVWTAARDIAATRQADLQAVEPWAQEWERQVCEAFLGGYLARAGENHARTVPHSIPVVRDVVAAFQVDKAIYEMLYELRNRPNWLPVPLRFLARFEPGP